MKKKYEVIGYINGRTDWYDLGVFRSASAAMLCLLEATHPVYGFHHELGGAIRLNGATVFDSGMH